MKHIDPKVRLLSLFCMIASITAAIHYSNPFKGFMHGIFLGLPFTLMFVFLIAAVERLVKSKSIMKVAYICVGVIAIISLIAFHKNYLIPSSTELFTRVFNSALPASVTDMELSVDYPGKDMIFRMKFTIDEAHFEPLLTAFAEDKPWRPLTHGVLNSRDSLLSYLQVVWLEPCENLPWWNLDNLVYLPQYRWDDEHFWRRMWLEQQGHEGKYIVYLAGVW